MKILITGANGNIGINLTKHLSKKHTIIASDINTKLLKKNFNGNSNIEIVFLDISDIEMCKKELMNIDFLIHLAGIPSPDSKFDTLLELNITGTYNVLHSFYKNNGKNIIVASSAQISEGYPVDVQTKESDCTRPKNLYGVSKSFVEQLSNYYSYQCDMQVTALRIGAYDEINNQINPLNRRDLSAFLDPDDFNHLIDCILIKKFDEPYNVYNAISNNTYKRLSIEKARKELGYNPQKNAFLLNNYIFEE